MRSDRQFIGTAFSLILPLLTTALPAKAAVPDGPVDGFGEDLPLVQAVEGIVPANLHVVVARDVDSTISISWNGGPSWKQVLGNALGKAGLVPRIEEGEVLIDHAPPPAQIWDVLEGETVAQTIARWSRQAGYTPVPTFTAQDRWRLFVSEHFSGTFDEALEWLSKGFSRQPSKPVFYLGANKTIDILSQPTGATPIEAGSF